jgi:ABC-2 type transport system ATP-binding protein
MQQKVQFIATVMHKPKLLIFDEPFSGFDPINVNLLKEEILNLRNEGATIIFSTHNMASVEELCDDIALINNSEVILSGSIKDIKNRYKPNIFSVDYRSEKPLEINPTGFEVLKTTVGEEYQTSEIRLLNGSKANDLMAALLSQVELNAFNEVIPSINDIFIQEVSSTSKNPGHE